MSLRPLTVNHQPLMTPGVTTIEERRLQAATPPLYLGFVRILHWSQTGRSGSSVRFRLDTVDDAVKHPFCGLRWASGVGEGQRLRIGVTKEVEGAWETPLFSGEASLAWWVEDCKNGMQVVFRLDDGPDGARDRHPFQGMAQGKEAETLALACWAIGDDELPCTPPQLKRGAKVPFAAMDATKQAAIKCADPLFREWCSQEGISFVSLEEAAALPDFATHPAEFTEGVVRALCRVTSRSELKQAGPEGDRARMRWIRVLRRYGTWRSNRLRR